MLNNPVQPAFDPMSITAASSPQFSFTTVPAKGVAGAPEVVKVSSAESASPLAPSLFVNAIRINELACVPTPCTPTSNKFGAKFMVGFDSSRLVMALAPLRFPIMLSSTGTANNQTLTSCSLVGSGGSSIGGVARFTSSGTWVVPNGVDKVLVSAIGGGGGSGGIGNHGTMGGPGGSGNATSLQGCAVIGGGGSGSSGVDGMTMGNSGGGAGGIALGGTLNVNGDPGGSGGGPSPGGGGGGTAVGACAVSGGSTVNVIVGTGGAGGHKGNNGWLGNVGRSGVLVLQW